MANLPTRYQSVCRWSFHSGKGGFVPGMIRPEFKDLTPEGFAMLVAEQIKPRVPKNTRLGVAVHYDKEVNEETAEGLVKVLNDNDIAVSMGTPGGHFYFGFGGIASPDPEERRKANEFGIKAADLVLGPLSKAEDPKCPIAFDIWNGSFGYDIPDGRVVKSMIGWADEGIGNVTEYIFKRDSRKKVGIEPKPNEGHSAMIYQTSADVLALRGRLARQGLDVSRFGLINEFGHTEMIGLDVVQDYAAGDLEGAIVHVHANSQGGDGVRLGGGGKFDIDFGVAPSSSSIGVAQILHESGYKGWIEHDMQPRAYDNAQQDIDRVVRAICNWEAICRTVEGNKHLSMIPVLAAERSMMMVEDYMRDAVCEAHALSKELYYGGGKA